NKEQAKNDAVNPLVNQDGKLIPSVTRVFHTDRDLYVYLQAYAGPGAASGTAPGSAPAPASGPLVAYVSMYRDGKRVLEVPPVQGVPVAGSRLGLTPLGFRIGMGKLSAGEYQCQVTVLDPG